MLGNENQMNLFVSNKMLKNEKEIRELTRLLIKDWASDRNYWLNERTNIKEYALSQDVKNFITENKLQYPDIVIAHIKAFNDITVKIANDVYGIRYLPSVIKKIKNRNYSVDTKEIEDVENRFTQAVKPVKYFFVDVVMPEFKEKYLRKMGA
jgi:hypothetical protein